MHKLELKIPPPAVLLLTALLIWGTSLLFSPSNWHATLRTSLAIISAMIGFIIALSGVIAFRKIKTSVSPTNPHKATSLVCNGIYRYTRNPMYLGLTFLLTGFVFFLGNIVFLLWVVVFIIYITQFQIKPEERILTEKFGIDFENYKKSVKRWL